MLKVMPNVTLKWLSTGLIQNNKKIIIYCYVTEPQMNFKQHCKILEQDDIRFFVGKKLGTAFWETNKANISHKWETYHSKQFIHKNVLETLKFFIQNYTHKCKSCNWIECNQIINRM